MFNLIMINLYKKLELLDSMVKEIRHRTIT